MSLRDTLDQVAQDMKIVENAKKEPLLGSLASAAIYYEAHLRALTFHRLYPDQPVAHWERRIEEEMIKQKEAGELSVFPLLRQHDSYVNAPSKEAHTRKLVDARVKEALDKRQSREDVTVTYTNPVHGRTYTTTIKRGSR